MRHRILAALAAATLGLASAPVVSYAADTETTTKQPELTATGHKPGFEGFGVDLPKDLKYKTADGKEVTHPCAGRKMAYHSHNDALYATKVNGKLTLMSVDGQQVVPMDDLCFRLAPDADGKGNEVSRYVIDKKTDFLGKEGDIVWIAPQEVDWMNGWPPLWSGLGAFDPNHEAPGNVPKGSTAYFDMLDFQGPGDVQIFRTHLGEVDKRYFNSADENMHTIEYNAGGHGHFNWTFTKPGIYAITWQTRLKSPDGEEKKSEPVTQYWLVGDDPAVGLKEGTTTDLNKITKTIEEQAGIPATTTSTSATSAPSTTTTKEPSTSESATEEPSTESSTSEPTKESATSEPSEQHKPAGEPGVVPDADTNEPSNSTSPTSKDTATTEQRPPESAPAQNPRCDASTVLSTKPDAFITSGHMDLALQDTDGTINARLHDDSDPSEPAERESGTFLFEVNDAADTEIPDSLSNTFLGEYPKLWVLPQVQMENLPWLGFSTTGLTGDSLEKDSKVTVTMKDVVGPGDLLTWHETLGGVNKELDSRDPSSSLTYGSNDHDHQAFGFSEPGLYAATFVYSGTDGAGKDFNKELRASFAVGQDAIEEARGYRDEGYATLPDSSECSTDAAGNGAGADSTLGGTREDWDKLISAVDNIGKGVTQIGALLTGGPALNNAGNVDDTTDTSADDATNSTTDDATDTSVDDASNTTVENTAEQTGSNVAPAVDNTSPVWEAFVRMNGKLMGVDKEMAPLFQWYLEMRLTYGGVPAAGTNYSQQSANGGDADPAPKSGSASESASTSDSSEAGNTAQADTELASNTSGVVANNAMYQAESNNSDSGAGAAPGNHPGGTAGGNSNTSGGSAPSGSGVAQAGGNSNGAVKQASTGSSSGTVAQAAQPASASETVGDAESGELEQPASDDEEVPDADPSQNAEALPGGTGGITSSIDGQKPAGNKQNVASKGMANGGFWAGLSFGIGAMALIGGVVLFSAAWRALRSVQDSDADLAATQVIK